MKISVTAHVRSVPSRDAFKPSTYIGYIDTQSGTRMGTSRGHESWSSAMRAAVALAKRRHYNVLNEALVMRAAAERDGARP